MINGSLINSTTYNDDFSSLGYIERGFIFFYLLTVLIISTLGNAMVLVMSKSLKAATRDTKGSILLIHVAFIDLMFNPMVTFGMLVSVLSRDWKLGGVYCFISAIGETYIPLLEFYFIFIISLHRAITIKFPFKRNSIITLKRLYIVIGFGYGACTIPVVIRTLSTIQIAGYVAEEFHCDMLQVAKEQPWVALALGNIIIFSAIPITLTVVLYLYLIRFAMSKSVSRHTPTQGNNQEIKAPYKAIKTVSLIIGIYLFSITPSIILILIKIRTDNIPDRVGTFAALMYLINTAANPLIYVNTNKTFREYRNRIFRLKTKEMRKSVRSIKRKVTVSSMVDSPQSVSRRFSNLSHGTSMSNASIVVNGIPGLGRTNTIMRPVKEESCEDRAALEQNDTSLVIENNAVEGDQIIEEMRVDHSVKQVCVLAAQGETQI